MSILTISVGGNMKDHFRSFLSKSRNRLFLAILINTACMTILYLTTIPAFETNDDNALMEIVCGSRGQMDAHMAFINYVLGLLMKFLYTWTAGVPWYAILEGITIWLGLTAITYVLLSRRPDFLGLSLSLILIGFFAYTCYVSLQFTKVAAVGGCGGIFLALYGMDREKPAWGSILAGTAIAGVGCMWRFKEFYICAALLSAVGIFMLLALRAQTGAVIRRRLAVYIPSVLLFIGIPTALTAYDWWIYQTNEEWHAFQEYNDARSELFDYGWPDYSTHKEEYAALDIDENAFSLYRSWNYYDPDKFNLETMQKISEMKEPRTVSGDMILSFLRKVPVGFFEYRVFYCALLFILLWIMWGKRRRQALPAIVYELAVFTAIYFLMFYQQRYLLSRVDLGLFLAVSLFFGWMVTADTNAAAGSHTATDQMDRGEQGQKIEGRDSSYFSAYCILITVIVLTMAVQQWHDGWRSQNTGRLETRLGNLNMLHMISSDKEHLYIGKTGIIGPYICYGPFEARPVGEIANRGFYGGWACNTPVILANMKRYGVTNPYRDCVDNDAAYILDDEIDSTIQYIRTYYYPDAEYEEIKRIGRYGVYSVRSSGAALSNS